MTPLSTRISGTVRKMNVNDYEAVKPGQLLVQLEDADYRADLEEAKAGLAGAKAEYADNQAAKKIQDAKILNAEAGVTRALAAVKAAEAGIASVQPDVERYQLELKRQQALIAAKATTHQQLEQTTAAADQYTGMLASHQADLASAQAALASSRAGLEAEKAERAALDTKDSVYLAQIKAREAAIVVAEVTLGIHADHGPDRRSGGGASCARGTTGRTWHADGRPGQGRRLGASELQGDAAYQYPQGRRRRHHHRYLPRSGSSWQGGRDFSGQRVAIRAAAP